jgi:glycerophosphoryl diester phosphodiesterase
MSKLLIPKVIGHRGAKAYAPENTLASIHTAADLGTEWVEIDVKLTKDDVAVIFHDEELNRCTNASGLVAETDFEDLRELDAGSWFGESFMGEKIPTLEEALDAILARGLGVNLEIKPCPGRERETAEVMLDVATRIWPEDLPPPLVSSFQHVSLEAALEMMPEWPRGLLIEEWADNWRELMEYLDAATVNIGAYKTLPEQLEQYLSLGKPVLGWTVNDPAMARRLLNSGLHGVFSDNPDIIRDAVETKH